MNPRYAPKVVNWQPAASCRIDSARLLRSMEQKWLQRRAQSHRQMMMS